MSLVNAFGELALEVTLAELATAMKQRYDPVLTAKGSYVAPGTFVLVDPPAAARVRAVWLYAQALNSMGSSTVMVTFTLGDRSYDFELGSSQPIMHGAVWEGGLDDQLTVTIDNAPVIVNCDYRIF